MHLGHPTMKAPPEQILIVNPEQHDCRRVVVLALTAQVELGELWREVFNCLPVLLRETGLREILRGAVEEGKLSVGWGGLLTSV